MATAGNSYSSAHLRERDKILEAKHQKELTFLERRCDRLRWSNDDTLKQLFDTRLRGDKLARSLGFNDIHEAQVAIDTADYETPLTFKDCIAQVDALRADLARERAQHEKLREYLRLVEEERDQQKTIAETAVRTAGDLRNVVTKHQEMSDKLTQEVSELQSRYDALSDVKERAAERYKCDYQKWRKFKNWLFSDSEEGSKGSEGQELSAEEKKRRRNNNVMIKKKLVMESGLDYAENCPEDHGDSTLSKTYPPPMGRTSPLQEVYYPESNKENHATPDPFPERKRRRLTEPTPSSQTLIVATSVRISSSSPSNATTRVASPPLKSLSNTIHPTSSPISLSQPLTNTTRRPLTFQPISMPKSSSQIQVKEEPVSSPSVPPVTAPGSLKRMYAQHASSDTEDDSQAIDHFPATTPVFKVPAPPTTFKPTPIVSDMTDGSQTEDESQNLSQLVLPPSSRTNSVTVEQHTRTQPSLTSMQSNKDRRRSDSGIVSVSHNDDTDVILPPRKMRRFSGGDGLQQTPALPKTPVAILQKCERDNGDTRGSVLTPTPASLNKGTKKEKANSNASTSLRGSASGCASAQKRLQDYSAFKGRGRYAKDFASTSKTINAEYAIDPARNGGLEFQFDEVVRAKEDRRRMDAGDCECCRDYYTAIGPLPSRLQAPRWRSPTNSPVKSKGLCPRHGGGNSGTAYGDDEPTMDSERHAAIVSHKQAISRHRHHWERPRTPPGYWNIGFPDTQEAASINEKAQEMHRRKREAVESEARTGVGRYKRRQET